MRLTKVIIRDHQSIKRVELEIGRYTVLVGDSEQGKSAIMRAIAAVFTNPTNPPPPKSKIRHGAKSYLVELTFDTGHHVKYEKGGSARYEITVPGKEMVPYDKMGREVPEELKKWVHIWEVDEGDKRLVQIQRQLDSMFLLGGNKGKLSRVLDDLDGRIYRKSLTACQTNLRSLKRQMSETEKEKKKWGVQLEHLSEVDDLAAEHSQAIKCLALLTDWWSHRLPETLPDMTKAKLLTRWTILNKLPDEAPAVGLSLLLADWIKTKEWIGQLKAELELAGKVAKTVKAELFSSGYCPLCKRSFDETEKAA